MLMLHILYSHVILLKQLLLTLVTRKEKSVKQQLEEQNADIVLFIYNDTNVYGDMYKFQNVK